MDCETERGDRLTDCETARQTDGQTEKEADILTDRERRTDRRTMRERERLRPVNDRHTREETDKQIDGL